MAANNVQINVGADDILGDLRTNTHVTAGMAAAYVGQTGNEVTIAGADGATACTGIGFFMEGVAGNRAVRIATGGRCLAIAQAAFAAGSYLMVGDKQGRLCKCDLATAKTPIVALALSAANAIDDEVVVKPVFGVV